ncbi:hypothetical protein F0L17_01175 [Streptomyces sp. TRM43335]|uniref:Uncharacterized protein n=1 Tax=Streptomyces taklimakanensis TaxID=2569853 RepID=A0A6G2B667_9ACTN|nr:hypothetical protein [Streptomyces taklimakanensis]MTE17765.1 hypothetical protein [Streptomyces taklimakanensis]
MAFMARFVTHVELSDVVTDPRQMSVSARLEAELADGRSLTLLDDRGWSSALHGGGEDRPADIRSYTSIEEIETTARMVVGPDEPTDGRTHEEVAAGHWARLAETLGRQGVDVDARELGRLPHDVVLGERLRAWIAGEDRP